MRVVFRVLVLSLCVFPPALAAQPCPTSCPTPDEVQVQALLDAAAASGGGTVVLDARVYTTCRPLIVGANVHLRGAGRGATIIRGSTVIENIFVGNSRVVASVSAVGVSNVSVSDLTIDHATCARHANGVSLLPDSLPGDVFSGTPVSNAQISRVEVRGTPGFHSHMIWNMRGQHIKITDNWIDGGGSSQSEQEGIESFGGLDVLISGNTVLNIGQACINLGSAGLALTDTRGVIVENNYLSGCHVGINLGTSRENGNQLNSDTHIRGNVISDIRQYGIDIAVMSGTEERNLDISGNTIRDVSGSQSAGISLRASNGVLDSSTVVGTTVARNHIDGVQGENAHGIRVVDYPNARLLDNTISGTDYEGVAVFGSSDVDVAGNRIDGAGTIPLGIYSSAGSNSRRITIDSNRIGWASPYAGMILAGVQRAVVRDNVFARDDVGAAPSPVVVDSVACGITVGGSTTWYPYPGTWFDFSTGPCLGSGGALAEKKDAL
jgi:parallel beta-helix repeat protein